MRFVCRGRRASLQGSENVPLDHRRLAETSVTLHSAYGRGCCIPDKTLAEVVIYSLRIKVMLIGGNVRPTGVRSRPIVQQSSQEAILLAESADPSVAAVGKQLEPRAVQVLLESVLEQRTGDPVHRGSSVVRSQRRRRLPEEGRRSQALRLARPVTLSLGPPNSSRHLVGTHLPYLRLHLHLSPDILVGQSSRYRAPRGNHRSIRYLADQRTHPHPCHSRSA